MLQIFKMGLKLRKIKIFHVDSHKSTSTTELFSDNNYVFITVVISASTVLPLDSARPSYLRHKVKVDILEGKPGS